MLWPESFTDVSFFFFFQRIEPLHIQRLSQTSDNDRCYSNWYVWSVDIWEEKALLLFFAPLYSVLKCDRSVECHQWITRCSGAWQVIACTSARMKDDGIYKRFLGYSGCLQVERDRKKSKNLWHSGPKLWFGWPVLCNSVVCVCFLYYLIYFFVCYIDLLGMYIWARLWVCFFLYFPS